MSESEDALKLAALNAITDLSTMLDHRLITPEQCKMILPIIFRSFNMFVPDRDLVNLVTEFSAELDAMPKYLMAISLTLRNDDKTATIKKEDLEVSFIIASPGQSPSQSKIVEFETEAEASVYFDKVVSTLNSRGFK